MSFLGFLFFLAGTVTVTSAGAGEVTAVASTRTCVLDRVDETAVVASVIDGDTLVLTDGRHVRLIGINAPEIAHGDTPAQRYGVDAQIALRARLPPGSRISLRKDREPNDKYGRSLAHLATADGINLSAAMLSAGLAMHWVVPPNDWNAECYAGLQRSAKQRRTGLWSIAEYRAQAATEVARGTVGYHIVSGKVTKLRRYAEATLLYLDGPVRLRIRSRDMHYFAGVNLQQIVGTHIEAGGWIHPARSGSELLLRHPASLELVEKPRT